MLKCLIITVKVVKIEATKKSTPILGSFQIMFVNLMKESSKFAHDFLEVSLLEFMLKNQRDIRC